MPTTANAEESRTDDLIQLNSMNNSTLSTILTMRNVRTWQPKFEALLGVLGIRDNWQNNFRDKG